MWENILLKYRGWYRKSHRVDFFLLLDYFLVLGDFWYLYKLLEIYQFSVQAAMVAENLINWPRNGKTTTVWSLVALMTMTLCYVKQYYLRRNRETINGLREFISIQRYHSGDDTFDSNTRWNHYWTSQRMIMAMGATILANQAIMLLPSPLRDRLFGIPSWMYTLAGNNEWLPAVAHFGFYSSYGLIWVGKLYCSSAVVSSLLIALNAELWLLQRNCELLAKDSFFSGEMRFYRRYGSCRKTRALFWRRLKEHVGLVVEWHNLLLEKLQSIRTIFEAFFFLIYYQVLLGMGAAFYVILSEGFSYVTVGITSCVVVTAIECYWWCHLIDSFQDAHEALARQMYLQGVQMPYSSDHRSDYVQMRTSLLIIATAARNSVAFRCGGIFRVSTASFNGLVSVSYSVLMFLLNIM